MTVAVTIPLIESIARFVGALCISVLGLICPSLMEICVSPKHKLSDLTVAKNIFFIVIGLVGLLVGTYTSVRDIIDATKNSE